VVESCFIFSSRSRRPVRKLLVTHSYRVLGTPIDVHRQMNTAEQAPEKCTDGDMVVLIT